MLVFQYGSNCTGARLNAAERLNGRAQDLGAARSVDAFDLAFDIYSQKNGCAAADIVGGAGRQVWGVLFEIPEDFVLGRRADRQRTLAQIEGSLYEPVNVRVRRPGASEDESATTFTVRASERRRGVWTSTEYVGYIVRGLRAHGVPEDYVLYVIERAVAANHAADSHSAIETRGIDSLREPGPAT